MKFIIRIGKKRYRLRIVKKIFYRNLALLLALVVGFFALTRIDYSALFNRNSSETTAEVAHEIHFSDSVSADTVAFAALTTYLDGYYTALANLKDASLAASFDTSTAEGYRDGLLCDAALSSELALYRASQSDLSASSVKYFLTITKATSTASALNVEFTEDVEVKFNALAPSSSFSYDIAHTASIVKSGETYLLAGYTGGGMLNIVTEQYEIAREADAESPDKTLIDSVSASLSALYEGQKTANAELSVQYAANPASFAAAKTAQIAYNRSDAVIYANSWYHSRNPDYSVYDAIGGNCNNYVSQCLHAGGIPMDADGNANWKHYSGTLNEKPTESGRSTSWTGVAEFYNYCAKNEGFGLCAVVDSCFFTAEDGDVFQIKDGDNWSHSIIVTGTIKNAEGAVLDFAVNSNTTDRRNYPISAYPRTDLRLIKIIGYNETK